MAVSAYFYLGIWIMSLIQLFASQSSKPNIIMIVADDLVSWKFILRVLFLKKVAKIWYKCLTLKCVSETLGNHDASQIM